MKWRILTALALAELLGLALWFSASAVTPALAAEWGLSGGDRAWLTMSVQIGFVAGALLSALLNIADMFNARRVFAVSAVAGAACNGAIPAWVDGLEAALILRFFTGFFLAGVYPPGMKIVATWFKQGRGLAIGIVVGALTIGSAAPHLLKVVGSPDWQQVMYTASVASVAAALICAFAVRDGPPHRRPGPFRLALCGSGHGGPGCAAGQPRIPGAHVGTLRGVDLDSGVPAGQLHRGRHIAGRHLVGAGRLFCYRHRRRRLRRGRNTR